MNQTTISVGTKTDLWRIRMIANYAASSWFENYMANNRFGQKYDAGLAMESLLTRIRADITQELYNLEFMEVGQPED